jgi:hypothetical protein
MFHTFYEVLTKTRGKNHPVETRILCFAKKEIGNPGSNKKIPDPVF